MENFAMNKPGDEEAEESEESGGVEKCIKWGVWWRKLSALASGEFITLTYSTGMD